MQVLPGIYLVNGFPYGRHQNGYVVQSHDTRFMIDAGDLEEDTFDEVPRHCARWQIEPAELTHLLVTHAHFDHASHAARYRRMGVKIVASASVAEAMAAGDDRCIGYAVGGRFEPCETDAVVEDGQTLKIGSAEIRCIAAPGHAEGCMVYELVHEDERVWFAGDILEIGPECRSVQLGWSGGPDYDRTTYLATLQRLAYMDCDHLLAGHGPPCLGFGRRLIGMAYTRAMVEWR